MFRVIDTIRYDDILLRRQPELALQFGLGLLVILDPAQITSAPVEPGVSVRIHRPDGTSFDRVVSGVECPHSVVGLFFREMAEHEIPRLSQIELLAG